MPARGLGMNKESILFFLHYNINISLAKFKCIVIIFFQFNSSFKLMMKEVIMIGGGGAAVSNLVTKEAEVGGMVRSRPVWFEMKPCQKMK